MKAKERLARHLDEIRELYATGNVNHAAEMKIWMDY